MSKLPALTGDVISSSTTNTITITHPGTYTITGGGSYISTYGSSGGSLGGTWSYHLPPHRASIEAMRGAFRPLGLGFSISGHLHYTLTPEYSIQDILKEAIAAEVSDG